MAVQPCMEWIPIKNNNNNNKNNSNIMVFCVTTSNNTFKVRSKLHAIIYFLNIKLMNWMDIDIENLLDYTYDEVDDDNVDVAVKDVEE